MRISALHRRGPSGRRRQVSKSAAASGSVGFLSVEFIFGRSLQASKTGCETAL